MLRERRVHDPVPRLGADEPVAEPGLDRAFAQPQVGVDEHHRVQVDDEPGRLLAGRPQTNAQPGDLLLELLAEVATVPVELLPRHLQAAALHPRRLAELDVQLELRENLVRQRRPALQLAGEPGVRVRRLRLLSPTRDVGLERRNVERHEPSSRLDACTHGRNDSREDLTPRRLPLPAAGFHPREMRGAGMNPGPSGKV